jgi:hypothetical protein
MRKFKFFKGFSKPTLTASWSPELAQDVPVFHNIDAERELTNLLSEELSRTIDEDIIRRLTRDINGGLRA